MKVSELKRIFKYGNQTFPDIENFSPDQVKDTYANSHPELLNATIESKGYDEKEGAIVYEFKKIAGTKG